MIFTCNFANWKKIPVPVTPISIARYQPKGVEFAKYEPLMPPADLLGSWNSNAIDQKTFTKYYCDMVLANLNVDHVVNELYYIAEDEGKMAVVLLCYEASNKFCHRHIVRDWMKRSGIATMEFEIKPVLKTSLGLRKK